MTIIRSQFCWLVNMTDSLCVDQIGADMEELVRQHHSHLSSILKVCGGVKLSLLAIVSGEQEEEDEQEEENADPQAYSC
jgi:hypothetical protein